MNQQTRFGAWSFDPNTRTLESCGYLCKLEPRVARLLEFFIARPGELITTEELVAAVWGGRVVSDEAVRKGVSTLRRALARGGADDYIKTIHKRGYISQFPPAEHFEDEEDDHSSALSEVVALRAGPGHLRIVLASLAVLAVIALGVAVARDEATPGSRAATRVYARPFDLIVNSADTRRFGARLDTTMRRALVASGVETAADSGAAAEPMQDPAALTLAGSIDKSQGEYQVTVHIDDPYERLTLWSMQFQRPLDEAGPLVNQVASGVTGTLRCGIAARDAKPGAMPVRALGLFLQICSLMELRDSNDAVFIKMHDLTSRVVAIAPDLAVSQGVHAISNAMMANTVAPTSAAKAQYVAEARKAAALALKRDPDDGAASLALAALLPDTPQYWPQVEALLRRVPTRDMDYPLVVNSLVWLARQEGRLVEATELQRSVAELDPFSPFQSSALAWILATQSRIPEAQKVLADATELWPNALAVRDYQMQMALWHESPQRALRLLKTSTPLLSFSTTEVACFQAFLRAREHNGAAQLSAVREACRRIPHSALLPRMLAYLGDIDGAYESVADVDINTYGTFFLFFSEMHAFRHDPRFMAVAQRMGLVGYWQATDRWPDFCSEPDLPYDCRQQARIAAGG